MGTFVLATACLLLFFVQQGNSHYNLEGLKFSRRFWQYHFLFRYVCPEDGLPTPKSQCPAGHYCLEGTETFDSDTNSTMFGPIKCLPGTYCVSGITKATVQLGDITAPQPCSAGFYCEEGTDNVLGTGLVSH